MRENIGFCVGKVTPPGQANFSKYRTWLVQQGQLIHGEIARACTDTVSDIEDITRWREDMNFMFE